MLQPEQLALEFQRRFKQQYGIYPYSLTKVRNSKWWNHFDKFCLYSKLPDNSEKQFVHRLFVDWNGSDKLWPYVLSTKHAQTTEENVIAIFNCKVENLTEEEYIKETLKKCSVWCKNHSITIDKLKCFILDSANQRMADRGYYYIPLFLFSKTFINLHGITDEEKLKKSSIRAFYNNVYNMLKDALQTDFID